MFIPHDRLLAWFANDSFLRREFFDAVDIQVSD